MPAHALGTAFYMAGALSERVPPAVLNLWGNAAALVGGAVLAVLGHWALLLFGAMTFGALRVACWVGG